MMQEEAARLQQSIYTTHPFLPVVIRPLGHEEHQEYACLIEGVRYYLWDSKDWLQYRKSRGEWLQRFTERGQQQVSQQKKRKSKRKQVPA